MSHPASAPRLHGNLPEWLPPWLMLPSWLLSVVFHAMLVVVFMATLKSCHPTDAGTGEEGYRQVGIYMKEPTETAERDPAEQQPELATQSTFAGSEFTPNETALSEKPPVATALPQPMERPVIGPGVALPSAGLSDPEAVLKAEGIGKLRSPAALSQGETAFFGVKDNGTRFVYVVDCSGSMYENNALGVAKAEVIASLESLDATQQFQIIFYNNRPRLMSLRGDEKPQLYWATDVNRTLARGFIAGIEADSGTDHMPALIQAFRFNPEVIYFLTDAQEPQLRAPDLAEISRRNQGRSRVHCIEFGKGPEISADNFLKRLARQTGGSYGYRDITRFRR